MDDVVRVTQLATVLAIVGVLVTLPFTGDTVRVWLLVLLLALGVLAVVSARLPGIHSAWERAGFLITAAMVALLVRATGDIDSNYQDMFIIVPLTTALSLRAVQFIASIAVATVAALAPVWYASADADYVSDTIADAVVWAAASTVVFAITRRREEQAEELTRMSSFRSAFLQSTSHEIRTPLSVIRGVGQLLRMHGDELTTASRSELVDRLDLHAQRLERLLVDLLDVDRLARGVVELRREGVDLAALVTRVVASLALPADTVRTELVAVEAAVDPAKVERIVEHLVVNAVKHAGSHATIWIRIEESPSGALLLVEDDGPGVPDALKESAFEPFIQGDDSKADPRPGTGIGLTLVAEYARLHGGRAWVEDRPGGGARFSVTLPS